MAVLDSWIATVCGSLGLDPAEIDTALVLDLAREVAHGVARPAAPLTAYLAGLAVGRGADPAQTAALIARLAKESNDAEAAEAARGTSTVETAPAE